MADSNFDYEITDEIAVLTNPVNSGWTKELNLVSFNGKPAKYDIRSWGPDHDRMGKGITLSREELFKLHMALLEVFK